MTDSKKSFAPLPPSLFGAGVKPTFLSVLREAATIDAATKWREHFNRPDSAVDFRKFEDSIEGARLAEIERDEIARLNARSKWEAAQITKTSAPVTEVASVAPVTETKLQRQDRRLKSCEDAGLVMPASELGRLPDGVAAIGRREGASRQAFSRDVKAAIERRAALTKPGRVVRIK